MNTLPYPVLTNVLEVISASSEYSDSSLVRQKTLDMLFRVISAERAILILPDKTRDSSQVMIKNLEEKFNNYYADYFHQFDPLQLLRGMQPGRAPVCGTGVCTYSYDAEQATEYYNDFLKPQKIHHKLIANLEAEQEIYGRVVWMRSQQAEHFTSREIQLAKVISPYLAHALAYNELRERLELKGKILDYIEKQSAVGMLLLDEKLKIAHINPKAEELFSSMDEGDKKDLLAQLLSDCREIKQNLKGRPEDFKAIPRKRTIGDERQAIRFAATYKALNQVNGSGHSLLFMVCLEQLQRRNNIDPRHLAEVYQLSKREIDVANLLFSGLKNAQIADKLYISEITVKKHLQNIYNKVGVNNRTSLVSKMLIQ